MYKIDNEYQRKMNEIQINNLNYMNYMRNQMMQSNMNYPLTYNNDLIQF